MQNSILAVVWPGLENTSPAESYLVLLNGLLVWFEGAQLWKWETQCLGRRSCLHALSSIVLKKQNMHQQNSVLCLGLQLQFLPHLRVMPDVSVTLVLSVN